MSNFHVNPSNVFFFTYGFSLRIVTSRACSTLFTAVFIYILYLHKQSIADGLLLCCCIQDPWFRCPSCVVRLVFIVHFNLFRLPVAWSPPGEDGCFMCVFSWCVPHQKRNVNMRHASLAWVYSLDYLRLFAPSASFLLRGGGAYLHGFTPWKQFPPSTTEKPTTSSALYLLRTSHKRLNI